MATPVNNSAEMAAAAEKSQHDIDDAEFNSPASSAASLNEKPPPPWTWKLVAVILVTLVRFGGSWSSGITGAMKTTLKKQLKINNTQYALLEASEDFMTTVLILASGLLTDRLGGAELMVAKLGAFTGTSTANIIAVNTGDFAWVFWVAVFINFFTNICSAVFFWFNKKSSKKFGHSVDPVTGEKLIKKGKKLDIHKVLEVPWVFWVLMLYSLCYTSTAVVFSGNATELAEQRFDIDSVTAGWYTALVRYAGFFIVPFIGILIDFIANEPRSVVASSLGIFISMALVNWAPTVSGTAAAFGVYAVLTSYNPTVLIDGMRASLWQQSTFGTAYSLKIMMNNSINIVVRIVAGVIQDADNNSYDRVVVLYVAMAALSVVVSCVIIFLAWRSPDLRHLQWTRKQRMDQAVMLANRKERFLGEKATRNALISKVCFCLLMVLLLGGWASYIWGAITGHNS
ncbi:hypothetical protein PFICI_07617 [Pestalotiopsis fici W106-1]|uniref:Lysosomal dipeptide transporter MFSD1 n=1 Tax=Pestalotiopsis fici (strain W106-1 / CGMCC3.15140) TaxID=1229662 RepID=W3X1S7_PESFW|nr:uncharacterized protein PFICI_07617 [Pestalotiopsis fici W106-1]ETS80088.1 hypothetical protein PFICI_07617 [Pestalotiopsis fici W106-1]